MNEPLQASFGPNDLLQRTAHFFNPQTIKARSLAQNILNKQKLKRNKQDSTIIEDFNSTFWQNHQPPRIKITHRANKASVTDMEAFLANSQTKQVQLPKQRSIAKVYNSCKSHESIQRQKNLIENHLSKNTKESIPLNSIFNRTFIKRSQPSNSHHENQANPYLLKQVSTKSSPRRSSRIRVVCNPFLLEMSKQNEEGKSSEYFKQTQQQQQQQDNRQSFHSINSVCSHSSLRPSKSGKSFLLRKPQTKILNRIFSSRSESTN